MNMYMSHIIFVFLRYILKIKINESEAMNTFMALDHQWQHLYLSKNMDITEPRTLKALKKWYLYFHITFQKGSNSLYFHSYYMSTHFAINWLILTAYMLMNI